MLVKENIYLQAFHCFASCTAKDYNRLNEQLVYIFSPKLLCIVQCSKLPGLVV